MTAFSRRALLGGLASLGVAHALGAQEADRERFDRAPLYRILAAPPETHALSRHDVSVDGHGYRLFLARPRAPEPAAGWPSIWMLDGNAVLDRLTAGDLAGHPGLAVVAVGYPVDRIFDTTARALDYTPTSLIPDPEGGRGRQTGGADAFRARLTGPLRRAIAGRVRLDPGRLVLWGHSYGGLFALHCLLSQPDAFAGWAPVSPSTGFGGNVLRHMAATAPHLAPGRVAPLRIMLGDSEHRRGTSPPPGPRPAPETLTLAEHLGQRPDLDVTVRILEGLGHGETFTASFPHALHMAAAMAAG